MPPTQKMTLKLPSAAKQAMMDGIGQALDKATALASVVGDAETDDTAAVPEELSTALKQIGEMFGGMATQYGGNASAATGADTDANSTNPPGDQPPPPNPNGGADMGKSAEATAKGLPAEFHEGDNIKQLLHDGDSFKTLLRKTVAAGQLEVIAFERLDKAGRKMAAGRFKKLSDLHDSLGKLLNELAYDDAAEAKAGMEAEKAKTPPPPPPAKDKKPEDGKAPAAKNTEGAPVAKTETPADPSLAEVHALMKRMESTIAKQGETIVAQAKELAAVTKASGVSNAGPVDGPLPKPTTDVQWATDMSEAVAKRQANGARK